MSEKTSDKQAKILEFVQNCIAENGYPPSVREICEGVGIKSTSTVHSYLEKLNKNGFIQKNPTKPRAIKLMDRKYKKPSYNSEIYPSSELVFVPVVGSVTAGQPILAQENITDSFPLPVSFVQNSDSFMLRIKGDSMVEAGIFDRDLVLVSKQSTASNGDIVVALIGDEATVKTFFKEKDYIRLQPENKYMDPIIVKDNISILGKVTGVFRKL